MKTIFLSCKLFFDGQKLHPLFADIAAPQGGWTEDTIPVILKVGTFLWDLPAGADKHLVILCGAGSLSVNTEHTLGGTDGADFPDAFKPLATLR